MRVGVPKEVKSHENRVGLTPTSVRELVIDGHHVTVEAGAGANVGFTDDAYRAAGAQIADEAATIFDTCDMVIKVKEPQPHECRQLRDGQVLFTYLHLAPDPQQATLLQESGCIAIAYETVTDARGGLPLLAPMSEVAGRMSVQAGARCLENIQGGRGVLLGGVPGVAPARVVVVGGGVVGTHAARMAMGLGADVTVVDRNLSRLKELDLAFSGRLHTAYSTTDTIEFLVSSADLVIGAVLIPGAAAPKVVTRAMVGTMHAGTVLVDVAIDQGGCFETSRATTHDAPTYIIDGVVHYCVTNMPGAVARTSTVALNNATLPFVVALANKGYRQACYEDPHLRAGMNVHAGRLTHRAVADALEKDFTPVEEALGL